MIINCNIKHYSKLENSPFGLGTFLCDTLGSYGILDFTDRILARKLTEEDEKYKIRRSIQTIKIHEILGR